jgi:hypothetical protein
MCTVAVANSKCLQCEPEARFLCGDCRRDIHSIPEFSDHEKQSPSPSGSVNVGQKRKREQAVSSEKAKKTKSNRDSPEEKKHKSKEDAANAVIPKSSAFLLSCRIVVELFAEIRLAWPQ